MFTQINGIYVDATTADAIRETEAIIAAFTFVPPAVQPAVSKPGLPRTHRMFQLVADGMSNRDAVARIKAEYGNDVPTNAASIAWVRQAISDAKAGKATKQAQYAVKTMAKLQLQ